MKVEIFPESTTKRERAETVPVISLPPDKSIFHRLLIVGSLTKSKITIPIPSIVEVPADVVATILALESLGVPIEISRSKIELQGVGINGFRAPKHTINCANSGTTARLMMGLLAGQNFSSTLVGDNSLSQRPMKRLADILNKELGANIVCSLAGTLPVEIRPSMLHGGDIELSVASAQIKTAVMLSAFFTSGAIRAHEPFQSRNHTELMLKSFGSDIEIESNNAIRLSANTISSPQEFIYHVPGDVSSAAFLIAAAIFARKNISLVNVGLNPTRIRFLELLIESGFGIEISDIKDEWNEKSGIIEIFAEETTISKAFQISVEDIPLIIDEIPILAVISAFCNGNTIFSHVGELRHKESDRIRALTNNLRAFGVSVDEVEDGFSVRGDENFIPCGGIIEHYGDHRIAMAMSVLALKAEEPVTISNAEIVSVSYPNFYRDLALITWKGRIKIS
ncbi:MAG: 3-phosphoshikimate 1-carboxyvinyltransferase [Candidatus Kapaibacterium sp.]